MRRTQYWMVPNVILATVFGASCNSFDEPTTLDPNEPILVVQTDDRVALSSPVMPPPVSGGTLLATQDGRFAVASDPDRDRVAIVELATAQLTSVIALEPGDEPGRLAEDGAGRVHIALRRGGAVVTVDMTTQILIDSRPVCGAPRGIAFDSVGASLHVACADGKLVSLPAAGGPATRTLELEPDLSRGLPWQSISRLRPTGSRR